MLSQKERLAMHNIEFSELAYMLTEGWFLIVD